MAFMSSLDGSVTINVTLHVIFNAKHTGHSTRPLPLRLFIDNQHYPRLAFTWQSFTLNFSLAFVSTLRYRHCL